jgi:hypothetical protein
MVFVCALMCPNKLSKAGVYVCVVVECILCMPMAAFVLCL